MPRIEISGYEPITSPTTAPQITIIVSNIESIARLDPLGNPLFTTIKIGINVHLIKKNVDAYLYTPIPIVPDQTKTIVSTVAPTPLIFSVSGSNKVFDASSYTFKF